jgi:hypothetical protein
MTCQFYGCDKPPEYGFPCCSMTHGIKVRDIKKSLKEFQNGELKLSDLYPSKGIDLPIIELEHYAQFL